MCVDWTIYLTPARLCFPFLLAVCALDSQVTRIEYVHSKSFVHKDISVDSLLVGLDKRASQADIIDFRARNYRSP